VAEDIHSVVAFCLLHRRVNLEMQIMAFARP